MEHSFAQKINDVKQTFKAMRCKNALVGQRSAQKENIVQTVVVKVETKIR